MLICPAPGSGDHIPLLDCNGTVCNNTANTQTCRRREWDVCSLTWRWPDSLIEFKKPKKVTPSETPMVTSPSAPPLHCLHLSRLCPYSHVAIDHWKQPLTQWHSRNKLQIGVAISQSAHLLMIPFVSLSGTKRRRQRKKKSLIFPSLMRWDQNAEDEEDDRGRRQRAFHLLHLPPLLRLRRDRNRYHEDPLLQIPDEPQSELFKR